MKYLVRQRFSYTGPDGDQIKVRTGDIVDTEMVASWKNGDAMLRAGFLVPHDDVREFTPTAEVSVVRHQRRLKKKTRKGA